MHGSNVPVIVLVLPGIVHDGLHLDVRGSSGVRTVRGQQHHGVVRDGRTLAALERAAGRGMVSQRAESRGRVG